MGILRSEPMTRCTLVLPFEKAKEMLDELGMNCHLQVDDMNGDAVYRPYKNYITRLDKMDGVIRFLTDIIGELGMGDRIMRNRHEDFLAHEKQYSMDALEEELKDYYDHFTKFRANDGDLDANLVRSKEELEVVQLANETLTGDVPPQSGTALDKNEGLDTALLEDGGSKQVNEDGLAFANISGVISAVDQERFAKTIFRATRGNSYVVFRSCKQEAEAAAPKSVFAIFFQGSSSSAMGAKVKRLCQAFQANLYNYPSSKALAAQKISVLNESIADPEKVLTAFKAQTADEMTFLVRCDRPTLSCSKIEEWRLFTAKEKNIYATLNMFEGTSTLRATCWVPDLELEPIHKLLKEESIKLGASGLLMVNPPTKLMPPTYIKTNELSAAFQELVDTYGIPRYQEANPALFAIISFPFLFGIMYGDIGHGLCLFLAGLYLCLNAEKMQKSQNETMRNLAWARYLVLFMGFFATYAGFMYNDLFSLGISLFDTRWTEEKPSGGTINWSPNFDTHNQYQNAGYEGPYPFGVDPAWHGATNELLFLNSLKMKLSVLVGVLQMLLGVFLKFGNSMYFKAWLDFVFECIPQLLFMLFFFGYMDFMIMYKWVNPVDTMPSIINSLICMGLGQADKAPMWDGSPDVAHTLMMICAVCVPVMWLPKPIIELIQHKMTSKKSTNAAEQDLEGGLVPQALETGEGHGHGHGEEFEFGEVMIHQTIETIEYVLGTVSHTASYLRLWALSLAHQQLSFVFFQKSVLGVCAPGMSTLMGGVKMFLACGVWFAITAAVLLGMDVLECFLHTLRLHWVEFQSKFYKAAGYRYEPFQPKAALTHASK
eukprot:gene257-749_t